MLPPTHCGREKCGVAFLFLGAQASTVLYKWLSLSYGIHRPALGSIASGVSGVIKDTLKNGQAQAGKDEIEMIHILSQ